MLHTINGYRLDYEQTRIVYNDSKHLLVVAGAGSGKTLTILGKIDYLINESKISPDEILCISFTRKAATSLEEKIKKGFNIKVPVYTFHKLALTILDENKIKYDITDSNTLDNLIHLFFYETILNYPYQINLVLKYFNIKNKNNIKKSYLNTLIIKEKEIFLLEKTVLTFINLFKCNNYEINDFNYFFKKIKHTFSFKKYVREKAFLLLTFNIYMLYIDYLKENNEIDFDDMIINATNLVKENYNKKIKYIIIDEYQDTSVIRFNLIKEILTKTGASLMVVGDDFQSIYRFTGCSLDLFLNFNKYFKDANIMKINSTYRNSQELINIAGKFVMKNKKQIRKKLVSNKKIEKPIKIIYCDDIKEEFKKLVLEIYSKNQESIMVLGRNNNDVNMLLDDDFKIMDNGIIIYKKNDNIKLNYLTVHKSKGLESSNVIIINLKNDYLGFPNKIKEEKILRLVSLSKDKYPYSEERRLFYVALTRTKNNVYLLTPKNNESMFIKELESYNSKDIEIKNN